ncbi:MAG TPA: HAMP domain-containing sensor histidine kinase [Candidatus Acidoferrales bacterium]|nr:HAMP domain-containing sensor histidine kinase [Candidatus Acidoferrales bacterium]
MRLAIDTLNAEDRDLLREYARRMMPHREAIGSAWAEAWVHALPARGVDPEAYRQVVDYLARESIGKVYEFILAGDFEGLYHWQYENNREGARRQLGEGAVLVFNQHELHIAGRSGNAVITEWIDRIFGEDRLLATRVRVAQEKLGAQLGTVLGEAYADEREGHLRALGDRYQRAHEVSERLRLVGQAITQSLEIEPVLDLGLQTAAELLQTESAGLTIANQQGTAHRLERIYGGDRRDFPVDWSPLEGSLTGWVFLNNQVARSGRRAPALGERAVEAIKRLGVQAYVVAPLRARGRAIGTLGVYRRTQRPFARADESILQQLADTLAIAIENARVYAEVRDALAAAESANRAKSEFIAAVSHEIRAPLSSVLGYVDLLRNNTFGTTTKEQRGIFERLDVITQSTLRLTNDLLDHARLEAGRLPVRVCSVGVVSLVEEIAERARLMLGERPVRVTTQIAALAEEASADPDRLRQILTNLVSNAGKFTANGKIEIAAVRREDRIEFAVRDTGSGISSDHLPRVFELFYRADSGNGAGAGIGLFLSRQLAQAMGGDLTVESELGRGTTFTLTLPAAESRSIET